MRHNISNVLCVIGAPLFESTLAPRRSIAFRNSAGTWSRAPGKQFGVLDRWRDRHTRPARWSDTLRIRPVRWRKWNRIRIDLARLADPIATTLGIAHARVTLARHRPPNLRTGCRIIATQQLDSLTVPSTPYVFNNCIYLYSTWLLPQTQLQSI